MLVTDWKFAIVYIGCVRVTPALAHLYMCHTL